MIFGRDPHGRRKLRGAATVVVIAPDQHHVLSALSGPRSSAAIASARAR